MLDTASSRLRTRLVLVLAVVFGALAMHGLTGGCASGSMAATHPMSDVVAALPGHTTVDETAVVTDTTVRAATPASVSTIVRSAHLAAHEVCIPDLPPRDAGMLLLAALVALFGLMFTPPVRRSVCRPRYRGPPPRGGSGTLIDLCVSRR